MDKPYTYKATVANVIDGDTVDLIVNLGFGVFKRDRFRLYGPDPTKKDGMNAPEKNTPEGIAALSWLNHKIRGLEVYIETIKDRKEKYGRYLVIIWLEGVGNINQIMIDVGHASIKLYAHQEDPSNAGRETIYSDVSPKPNSGHELRIADEVRDSGGAAGTGEHRQGGKACSGEEGRGWEGGVCDSIRPDLPLQHCTTEQLITEIAHRLNIPPRIFIGVDIQGYTNFPNRVSGDERSTGSESQEGK